MNYQNKTQSLDKLLLAKGLITHAQLTAALQYQCRLPQSQSMTLSEVLITLEYLTEAQIKEALGETPPDEDVLVQVLVREGTIQEEQLSEALQARDDSTQEKRLGTVLMELGHASQEVIQEALKHYYLLYQNKAEQEVVKQELAQKQAEEQERFRLTPLDVPTAKTKSATSSQANVAPKQGNPIGQKLVDRGLITADELQDAIDYQFRLPRILHKPIGEILVDLGYVTRDELDAIIHEHPAPSKDAVGQILVNVGLIQEWQLSHVMTLKYMPEHADKKIGTLIVEMGYARRPDIEAALQTHFESQNKG